MSRALVSVIFFVILLTVQTTSAQQAPSSGPTLEQTMGWVSDKLATGGGYSYSEDTTYNDRFGVGKTDHGSVQKSYQINQSTGCHLSYKPSERTTGDESDTPYSVLDVDLSLLAANSIKVKPFDLSAYAGAGVHHPKYSNDPRDHIDTAVTPGSPAYSIVSGLRTKDFELSDGSYAPIFADQDLALRVAKALNHAIDLCGGKPDLF